MKIVNYGRLGIMIMVYFNQFDYCGYDETLERVNIL